MAGESFEEVIDKELDAAQCVVVLWSQAAASSRWVRAEAGEAAERGILIPVLLEDDVKLPLGFRTIHAETLVGWNGDPKDGGIARLCEAIASRVPPAQSTDSPGRDNMEESLFTNLGYLTRQYLFNEARGLLIDPATRERVVGMSAATLSHLLAVTCSKMRELISRLDVSASREKTRAVARSVIETAGTACGERRGGALVDQFEREGQLRTILERARIWCDLESDAGFGLFGSDLEWAPGDRWLHGEILVNESFLTLGRRESDENVCGFLKGYIRGALETITKVPLMVVHRKRDCAQYVLASSTCKFTVAVDTARHLQQSDELDHGDPEEEL